MSSGATYEGPPPSLQQPPAPPRPPPTCTHRSSPPHTSPYTSPARVSPSSPSPHLYHQVRQPAQLWQVHDLMLALDPGEDVLSDGSGHGRRDMHCGAHCMAGRQQPGPLRALAAALKA